MKPEITIIFSEKRVLKKEEKMSVTIKIGIGGKYYIDIGHRRFFNKKVKVIQKLDNGAFKVKLLEEAGLSWPKYTRLVNINGDELSLEKHPKMKKAFNHENAPSPQQEKVRRGKSSGKNRRQEQKTKKERSGIRRADKQRSSKRDVQSKKNSRRTSD